MSRVSGRGVKTGPRTASVAAVLPSAPTTGTSQVAVNVEIPKIFGLTAIQESLLTSSYFGRFSSSIAGSKEVKAGFYEFVGMVPTYGFDVVIQYLQSTNINNIRQLIFNAPSFARNREQDQINREILRGKVIVGEATVPCHRCGSKKVREFSKQVRSSDEPMTVFFTCLSCGNKWKGEG